MKKVMIIGAGAQGSTIAKRLNEEENIFLKKPKNLISP
jgi:predicted dinucleotide-binding enzyme